LTTVIQGHKIEIQGSEKILTDDDNESRLGRSHEPISVFVHCSPSARQSRPINGIFFVVVV
jgi:hypothetical protein